MDSELFGKVVQREERMTRVKTLQIFPVAALHFAVIARCAGTNEIMSDTKFRGGGFKQGRQISSAVGKAVGERKAIVCLNALYPDSSSGIPGRQFFQKISGRVSGLLWISRKKTQTRELVNASILKHEELWVCDTPVRHHIYVHLNPLAEIGHLLIGFRFICFFLAGSREQAQFTHHPQQAL